MKILLDTSVLVAAFVQPHPQHARALPCLQRARRKPHNFFFAAHTMAELYAVLTRLPVSPRISTHAAWQLIKQNVCDAAHIVPLNDAEYVSVIRTAAGSFISGSAIYDALIAAAAKKAKVDQLFTFNVNDFERVWPEGGSVLHAP